MSLKRQLLSSSTRGLDSSTALEFVRALRIATDTFKLTSILCLYQAGESLYQHFDKVCVLYEGRMAYYGPADEARQYFIDMGQVSTSLFCSKSYIHPDTSLQTDKRLLISWSL